MTKKHFQAFASRIHDDLECARTRFDNKEYQRTFDAALYASSLFADIASHDNPRFDRDRFMAACGFGVKGGPVMARMNTYDLGVIQLRALRYRYASLQVALVGTIDGEPNFRVSRSDGTLITYRTWSQRDTTARTKGGR